MKRTPPGRVYAGGTPGFDERTGQQTPIKRAPIRPPRISDPKSPERYQSPPIMQIPGLPTGPFTPGEGGMSPGQLPTGPIPRTQVPTGPMPRTGGSMPVDESVRTMEFIDRNGNGIDDRDEKPPRGDAVLQPIKQPPIRVPPQTGGPMPPPNSGSPSSDDLFGPANYGSYDNLMSRAFQEYSGGQSPYAGATDFLMNRSVFDRGVRPESSMPSTTMPSFGYSNQGGMDGLTQMQAQQPALQAQYDQFQQDIQSAQEAAQQRAQEQSDLASSERQALMDRIAALEGQEGPDLDAFGAQLRQDILGEVDIDALRREITGEVLQIAQQDFPDVTQIRDEIMALLPEQEQIDVENLRRQIQESIDAGAPPEEIAALRQELQNRIRPVEEQLQGLQSGSTDIAQQLGELQGQVGSLPDIDVDAIREQIMRNLPEQERIDIEALQRRIQESIDAGAPEEEIAGLRLELEQRLAPVEERVGSIRDSVAQFRENFDPAALREQIGNLRGRLEGLPNFDIDEIRRRVQEGIELPNSNEIQDNLRRVMEERGGFVPPEVLERLRAVEGREGPDLSGIRERIAALREQQGQATEGRRGLSELLANVREQQGQAAEGRRAIEDRLGGRLEEVRGQVTPLTERIAQLRGRLDERPTVDMDAIARRVREGIDIPQVDLGGIREQIANLRGRMDERPTVDMDAIARRVREGIDIPQVDLGGIREQIANLRGRLDERVPAGTAGIKPLPAPPKSPPKAPPRMGTFPPGFRGRGRGNI
jgi:hypothetical protein